MLVVDKSGNRIKLIDFGLARRIEKGKKLQVLFGTFEFVSMTVVFLVPPTPTKNSETSITESETIASKNSSSCSSFRRCFGSRLAMKYLPPSLRKARVVNLFLDSTKREIFYLKVVKFVEFQWAHKLWFTVRVHKFLRSFRLPHSWLMHRLKRESTERPTRKTASGRPSLKKFSFF